MLQVIVGTKGQLIKMAPVMKEMDRAGLEYNFINASQHGRILEDIASLFKLRKYDYEFYGFGRDITKSSELVYWLFLNTVKNSFGGKIFKKGDWVVLHGDAPPALLGLMIAKVRGLRTMHVEAGERTYRLRDPFPEEFIRRVVDRYSDYLFALSDRTYMNLKKEGIRGKVWKIRMNTILDSVRMAVKKGGNVSPPSEKYVLSSIHRFETISDRTRLGRIVDTVDRASRNLKVVFPLHESTRRQLEAKNLMSRLKHNKNVVIMPLLDYFSFIEHINKAQYVITDGGGPQQETYLLGKPCLLMREITERPGYANTYTAGFDLKKIDHFIKNYDEYRGPNIVKEFEGYSPSKHIVRIMRENIEP